MEGRWEGSRPLLLLQMSNQNLMLNVERKPTAHPFIFPYCQMVIKSYFYQYRMKFSKSVFKGLHGIAEYVNPGW